METGVIAQPQNQLGKIIENLLGNGDPLKRIVFVSAFASLKTVLRFRENLLSHSQRGARVRLVLGIDLCGTSEEVLREIANWDCEKFVFHNPITRSTFHPKIYLFESCSSATLFIGSNNLTDGGMYSNYEVSAWYKFYFPDDQNEYTTTIKPLLPFLGSPISNLIVRINLKLIETLSERGMIASETEIRLRRQQINQNRSGKALPGNPFTPTITPMPPLLPRTSRHRLTPNQKTAVEGHSSVQIAASANLEPPSEDGVLVWRKTLPRSDALQVREGSNHVGGVRLTQAKFENPPGEKIDQTTYFRRLFDEYEWTREARGRGGHRNQEHTFVPIRVIILGIDHGVWNFEISHKPTGEAGQRNYTTILRWGSFSGTVVSADLTGTTLSLYETPGEGTRFLIKITRY